MSDFLSFLGVRHSLTPFYSQIFHVFHISFLHCLCYIIGVDFSASAHGAPGISRYRRSVYGKANGTSGESFMLKLARFIVDKRNLVFLVVTSG